MINADALERWTTFFQQTSDSNTKGCEICAGWITKFRAFEAQLDKMARTARKLQKPGEKKLKSKEEKREEDPARAAILDQKNKLKKIIEAHNVRLLLCVPVCCVPSYDVLSARISTWLPSRGMEAAAISGP